MIKSGKRLLCICDNYNTVTLRLVKKKTMTLHQGNGVYKNVILMWHIIIL